MLVCITVMHKLLANSSAEKEKQTQRLRKLIVRMEIIDQATEVV